MSKKQIKIDVDVSNAISFLKKTNPENTGKIEKAMKQIAMFMEGEVKQSLSGNRAEPKRVDTGRLRGSVKGVTEGKYDAKIQSNVEYSKYIEYGTSKLAPGRHFRNSVTRNKPKIIEYLQNAVKVK